LYWDTKIRSLSSKRRQRQFNRFGNSLNFLNSESLNPSIYLSQNFFSVGINEKPQPSPGFLVLIG
jgi:hypothetical protein